MIILISAALLLYDEGGVTGRGLPSPRGGGRSLRLGRGESFSPGLPLNSLQAFTRLVPAPLRPAQPLATRFRLRVQAFPRPSLTERGASICNMPVAATTQQANADARSEAKAFAKENVHGHDTRDFFRTTFNVHIDSCLMD